MFKKILKFILCIVLISGYVLPSYASLTASDGSAFVTRHDFNTAMQDFDGRLTTFEAGVNSKIDSQVTSYLDRNGIWSGEQQKLSTTASNLTWSGIAPAIFGVANNPVQIKKAVYIPKISKSGMLVGSWQWVGTGGNSNETRWGWYITTSEYATNRIDCGFVLIIKLSQYKEDGSFIDDPYSAVVMSGVGGVNSEEYNKYGALVAGISTVPIISPFKFFVTSESKIEWSLLLYYHYENLIAASPRNYSASTIKINMLEAAVY